MIKHQFVIRNLFVSMFVHHWTFFLKIKINLIANIIVKQKRFNQIQLYLNSFI